MNPTAATAIRGSAFASTKRRTSSCSRCFNVLCVSATIVSAFATHAVNRVFAQQPLTADIAAVYRQHKADLYAMHFADGWVGPLDTDTDLGAKDLLVIKNKALDTNDLNRNGDKTDFVYSPDSIGDSAWRTGLATIAVVLEGDDEQALKFLTALRDKCWDDGQPIRHPRWEREERDGREGKVSAIDLNRHLRAKWYSQDAFIPQMAACYLACKYSKDVRVKNAARTLLTRFISTLHQNDWAFGPRIDATLTFPGQYVLWCVARDLDLPHDWHPNVSRWGPTFAEYCKRQLIMNIVDSVTDKLEEGLSKASVRGQALPAEVQKTLVRAVREHVNVWLLRCDLTELLDKRQLDEVMNAKRIATGGWKETCILPYDFFELAVAEAFKGVPQVDALYDSLYESCVAEFCLGQFIRDGGRRTNEKIKDYYAHHLTFWELVVLSECDKMGSGLRRIVKSYAESLEHHDNIPFDWMVGSHERVFGVLKTWPTSWSNVEYMWKMDHSEQMAAASDNSKAELYPRLDFMVLYSLYKWKPGGLIR